MVRIVRCLDDNRSEFLARLVVCVFGILFVLICSYSTSPLFAAYYRGDSAQFLTIGKAWALGKIPYKELFDHKGPIIYFIDMLGFKIAGTKSGVCVFQIIFMLVTVNALYNIGKLSSENPLCSVFTTGIALIFLKLNYSEGNSVEEYCLPFITVSSYYQLRFFYQRSDTHPPLAALWYGMTLGVCALTRTTNAVIVCSGILIITIILLSRKRYVNLWNNMCSFLIGCLLISVPFIIYFYEKGCLSEFVYSTFTYNVEYLKKMQPWIKGADLMDIAKFLIVYFVYFCVGAAALFALWRKAYVLFSFYVLSFAIESYLFFSGASFVQYPAVCLPQLVFLLNEICLLENKKVADRLMKLIVMQMIVVICIGMIQINRAVEKCQDTNKSYEKLIAKIPITERNSFVAYGGNQFKELYLYFDLIPYYKYFVIQEWHAGFSETVRNDIYETFMKGDVKWILTDGNTSVIDDVLRQRYEQYDMVGHYSLFRLR